MDMRRSLTACVVVLTMASVGLAQDNPFAAVARRAYSGIYEGEDAKRASYVMVLCERGDRFVGYVTCDGVRFEVSAATQDGGLAGQMKHASGVTRAIKVIVADDKATLQTGDLRVDLKRRTGPAWVGIFRNGALELRLEPGAQGALKGSLRSADNVFQVNAMANGALCWGTFGDGQKSRPFTLVRPAPFEVQVKPGPFARVVRQPSFDVQFQAGPAGAVVVDTAELERQWVAAGVATTELKKRWAVAEAAVTAILPQLVKVESGSFQMGADGKAAPTEERPVHTVRITRGFLMGKYEVTSKQYEAVTGRNPGEYRPGDKAVEKVSWHDAMAFCRKLTAIARNAGKLPGGYAFRLPTEAEWEYAARGGTKSGGFTYAGSNDLAEVGWYTDNFNKRAAMLSVGAKKANELGLYDMSGNVWEWCLDFHSGKGYPSDKPVADPRGPRRETERVRRGGGSFAEAYECRATNRWGSDPCGREENVGFRIILAPSGPVRGKRQ